MEERLIHLYTGDGKGKTTASLGLLLRAYGHNFRIVLAQFLKGQDTGELRLLENLSGVTILRQTSDWGFLNFADADVQEKMKQENSRILKEAIELVNRDKVDLLILDEICAAYEYEIIDKEAVDKFIMNKPAHLELVLTGRNAPEHFIKQADYVTNFVKCKHPYDQGIMAREGIEF